MRDHVFNGIHFCLRLSHLGLQFLFTLLGFGILCRRLSGEPAAASDASRVEWVAEQNLREYRLTEGTLSVIERAFAKLQC